MSNDQELISIKELASQLKSSDALIKKIIKDFEIETVRDQKKVSLSAESVKTIRDILALRASGKKNNEIKELFYESKGIKPKASKAKAEVEKEAEESTEEEVSEVDETVSKETVSEETKEEIATEEKSPRHKKQRFKDKFKERRSQKQEAPEDKSTPRLTAQEIAEMQEAEAIEKDKRAVLDISMYLEDDEEQPATDELRALLSTDSEEDLEDLGDEEEIDEADEVEEIDGKLSPRKIRRRQFSFRYIQRQIANDSKRVNYLKQKLKRGKLSSKEKMLVEDSLYHRSNLLNGWIHLLRWVKS